MRRTLPAPGFTAANAVELIAAPDATTFDMICQVPGHTLAPLMLKALLAGPWYPEVPPPVTKNIEGGKESATAIA